MNNFKWIWGYSRKYRLMVFFGAVLVLNGAVIQIVNPLLSGRIIDDVIVGGKIQLLVPYIVIMIATTVIRTIIRYSYQIMFESVGQRSLFVLRQDMYKKLQELDFDYFNHTRVGDIMARMTGDTDAIRHFVSWVVYNIVECILYFVTAVIAMATISIPLTLAMLLVAPAIFILTQKMSRKAHPVFYQIRESFSRLNSMVEENISGNRVVKAFTREDYEIEKFNRFNDDYKEKNMASAKVSSTYLPWLESLAGSLTLICLLVGGLLVINDTITLGELIAFNSFVWLLNYPLRMSGWLINDVQRFSAACIKIRQMLETTPSIDLNNEDQEYRIAGDIAFNHVGFRFSDDPATEILTDITFAAKPGQTIGILGETGSGKTTLTNLIGRFYDPTSGEVLIDGKNAKDYPVRKLRENISVVMQDVFLFSDTIRDNISFGNPYADQNFIHHVSQIADADTFISRMPEGYDTIVGERGVGLSGGQKQRISLARALAKDPTILILDDTTSAVDMETETKIQQELVKLTEKKTTFIIAHRISSVREADLILLMSHGRIIERGNHESLMSQKGEYYNIYHKQLGLTVGGEG
ncbi:ABC transporter ATP-binding protein [Bavariicoccus seileri]|uniref:ABC transporter ATP-binding protein n=1 Tax=Bavariicoccus seileri TaxID=549685 RepID=UPI003F90C9E7